MKNRFIKLILIGILAALPIQATKHARQFVHQPNHSYSRQQLQLQAKEQEKIIKRIDRTTSELMQLQKYLLIAQQLNPHLKANSYDEITVKNSLRALAIVALVGTTIYAISSFPTAAAENAPDHENDNVGIETSKKLSPEIIGHAAKTYLKSKPFVAWVSKIIAESAERTERATHHEEKFTDAVNVGLIEAIIALKLEYVIRGSGWILLGSGIADIAANAMKDVNKDIPLDQRMMGAALASNLAAGSTYEDQELVAVGHMENLKNLLTAAAVPERLIQKVSGELNNHLKFATSSSVKAIANNISMLHKNLQTKMGPLYDAWLKASEQEIEIELKELQQKFQKDYNSGKVDTNYITSRPLNSLEIKNLKEYLSKEKRDIINKAIEFKKRTTQIDGITREEYEALKKNSINNLDEEMKKRLETHNIDTKNINWFSDTTPKFEDIPNRRISTEEEEQLIQQRITEYEANAKTITYSVPNAQVMQLLKGNNKNDLLDVIKQRLSVVQESINHATEMTSSSLNAEQTQNDFNDFGNEKFEGCPASHSHEVTATWGHRNDHESTSPHCANTEQLNWFKERLDNNIPIHAHEAVQHFYPF